MIDISLLTHICCTFIVVNTTKNVIVTGESRISDIRQATRRAQVEGIQLRAITRMKKQEHERYKRGLVFSVVV